MYTYITCIAEITCVYFHGRSCTRGIVRNFVWKVLICHSHCKLLHFEQQSSAKDQPD
jgi:hypothetical protein